MNAVGPMLLGCVVGWIIYYFIRRFSVASPQTLTATLAAFTGGPLLKFLGGLDGNALVYYFAGVGIGFFAFAIYLLILFFLMGIGRIDHSDFEFYAASFASTVPPRHNAFMRVMTAFKDWQDGKITEAAVNKAIKLSGLTRAQYKKNIQGLKTKGRGGEMIRRFEELNMV